MSDLPDEGDLSDELEDDELEDDLELSGEEGGENLEGGSDDPFFVSKQAAAVFKHKLLKVYFPKFAGKAGSTEADRRLVYVDTHAGRGAYDDGTEGSPLLIAKNAAGMAQRRIDCIFIEKRRSNHRHLTQVLTEQVGSAVQWQALRGTASRHLDTALEFAGNSPLFMFIDPYGLGPTFDEVVRVLNRPRQGWGSKTEVLLNFISGAFGRAGGYLRIENKTPQQLTTIENLGRVLDGDWWQELYLSTDVVSDAVELIALEYARRIREATNCSSTLIPVRNREHHLTLYWLVHFTRHPDGMWWIREAASQAAADWRRFCSPPPDLDDGGLFSVEELDPFPDEEKRRQDAWVDEIEANARALLSRQPDLRVRRDNQALFGATFGQAWAKHLRAALLRLHKEGLLDPRPYADGLEDYIGHRKAG